jgi:hypothetical protein
VAIQLHDFRKIFSTNVALAALGRLLFPQPIERRRNLSLNRGDLLTGRGGPVARQQPSLRIVPSHVRAFSRAGARSSRPMIQAFVFAAVALYALVGMIAA